jgi:ATP-dependent RNA helicase DDX5/DBP2
VLSPVRELGQQNREVLASFASAFGVKTACLIGGEASVRTQIQECQAQRPMIVVGTPGRLLDCVKRKCLDLSSVTFTVIDEADNMLRQDFVRQCRPLLQLCQPRKQMLMWSATWPLGVRELAKEFLNDRHVQVVAGASERTVNAHIRQTIVQIPGDGATIDDLWKVIDRILVEAKASAKIVIFVNSRRRVQMLVAELANSRKLWVVGLHGDMTQGERTSALHAFRTARPPCAMIATSILERGFNIDDVSHVIVYDMPGDIDDYVHRIARTARGAGQGQSFALFSMKDAPIAKKLVKVLKQGGQEVPGWLAEIAEVTGSELYRSRRSRF